MDEEFRRYYNEELHYLRELGSEFAEGFPKIAGRLGMKGVEVSDPYVERLLEGFAFLSTRVRLKLDAEFPRFTRHLLDVLYPTYLAPMPSMAVVQYDPDPTEASLNNGYLIPRHSSMRSLLGKDEQTRCEYRSAHNVTLWPIEVAEVKYYSSRAALASAGVDATGSGKAGLRITLRTLAGQKFSDLALDELNLFLAGAGAIPTAVYEQLVGHCEQVVVTPGTAGGDDWRHVLSQDCVNAQGFEPEQALLPTPAPSFDSYRLLQEYFAFPQRYLFVDTRGLGACVAKNASQELHLTYVFSQFDSSLVDVLTPDNFALHCTPCVNLFPKRADRIHLNDKDAEFHVIPDRARPMDFEVWAVDEVKGIGSSTNDDTVFTALYDSDDEHVQGDAHFVVNRERRRFSGKQRRSGARTSYMGSEVYLSLVDASQAPYASNLRQVEIQTLCTNRDLPLQMTLGQGATDFDLQVGAPVQSIRAVTGPTRPRASYAEGDTTWRLINSLNVNYLSMLGEGADGPAALKDLLRLFVEQTDFAALQQLDGLLKVSAQPVTARMPVAGPIAFGRGVGVELDIDESAFEGTGAFLMASVLERFFARAVTLNSFVTTTLRSTQRGLIKHWPARVGARVLL